MKYYIKFFIAYLTANTPEERIQARLNKDLSVFKAAKDSLQKTLESIAKALRKSSDNVRAYRDAIKAEKNRQDLLEGQYDDVSERIEKLEDLGV